MAINHSNELCPCDGYLGESSFQSRKNYSTYYDAPTDRQSNVPIRSIHKVKEELKEKFGGN